MGQIIQPGFNIGDQRERLVYGPGACILESLQNLRIGNVGRSNDYVCSMRFRALHSGNVTGLWLYFELGSGYATGGGGVIRFRIFDDDGTGNHRPNVGGRPYAEGSYAVQQSHINAGHEIRMFDVTPSRPLQAGRLYHVVFDNIAPAGTERWASLNTPQVRREYGKPARWLNNTDWAGLYSTNGINGNWIDGLATGSAGKLFSPMMAVRYAGGQVQGYTAFESGATDNRTWRLSSSTNRIREQYTSIFDRRICGMSIYTCCQVAGDMEVLIDIDGHRAAAFTIHATQTTYAVAPLGRSQIIAARWYDIQFPQDIFLPANKEMNIYFVAKGNSVWFLSAQRNGRARSSPVAFTHAETQLLHGSQWRPFNFHNHAAAQSADDTGLRMVLHVTPPPGSGQNQGDTGGGGNTRPDQGAANRGTFADFGGAARNFVWVRELPNPQGENRWLVQFMAMRDGGQVINNDEVRNMSGIMADREWSGRKTFPAIVWTGDKELPDNIRDYTYTNFTADRSNIRSVEPWHDVGIWHENATVADRSESTRK